jgi:hypothetical protein
MNPKSFVGLTLEHLVFLSSTVLVLTTQGGRSRANQMDRRRQTRFTESTGHDGPRADSQTPFDYDHAPRSAKSPPGARTLRQPKSHTASLAQERDFAPLCKDHMRSGHHVVISMTFNQGFKLSREHLIDTSRGSTSQSAIRNLARSKSMVRDSWFWDLVVLDETFYLHKRKSKQSLAIQRLVVKGMIAIGATETPLWNSPIDVIGVADAMRRPKVEGNRRRRRRGSAKQLPWRTASWLRSWRQSKRSE